MPSSSSSSMVDLFSPESFDIDAALSSSSKSEVVEELYESVKFVDTYAVHKYKQILVKKLKTHRPRHRRKATDIQRQYECDFDNCNKSYERISHLNTHRKLLKHGPPKRSIDFK